MKTLIIYDNMGMIRMTQAGDITWPESVAMAVTDIPDGKYAVAVNPVTGEVKLAVRPKSETEQRIETLEETVNTLLGGQE